MPIFPFYCVFVLHAYIVLPLLMFCFCYCKCVEIFCSLKCCCPNFIFVAAVAIVVVDGGWGDWSDWGQCYSNCSNTADALAGTKTRRRECLYPIPKNEGTSCVGKDVEEAPCAAEKCTAFTPSPPGTSKCMLLYSHFPLGVMCLQRKIGLFIS